jgi:dTDP-4-amino-4,6-dideoxygalactose transaminase
MNMIPYGRQFIEQDDIDAVVRVLKGTHLTQGQAVRNFEKAICEYTGAIYCVAVANGTAALHIAVAALGLAPGTEGITTPITFMATSNSMLYSRIKPIFADIDPLTYCLAPAGIERQINSHTQLIIPVHFAGQACDIKAINKIAEKHSCYVIEDAAHAIGSNYADGSKVGNCKYSDMTIFSFHPVKTITTGEGGAITTNDKALYEKLCLLRSHGITSDPKKMTQNPRPYFHEMHTLGFNYRITDIQTALGCRN